MRIEDYYAFLKQEWVTVSGVKVLDAAHLIPFKAKAWMNLTEEAKAGKFRGTKNDGN